MSPGSNGFKNSTCLFKRMGSLWNNYGYIAEPRDAESLAGKLLRLVDDSDKEKKFQSELMNMHKNRHGKNIPEVI